MLRSRGNRLPSERAQLALLSFSFSRSGRRACRLSLYRGGRAAPRLSPLPLSYSAATRPLALSRAVSAHREDFSDPSSLPPLPPLPSLLSSPLVSSALASARKRIGLGCVSLPPPPPPSPSRAISSPDRLYRPVDFSSAFRDRASRWSSAIAATGAHAYVHTYTRRTRRGALFPRRTAPFFERARPRFLADFIPIPRNKLADDHGGICLLGDLFSPLLSLLLLLICVALCRKDDLFLSFSQSVRPACLNFRDASLPREKKAA